MRRDAGRRESSCPIVCRTHALRRCRQRKFTLTGRAAGAIRDPAAPAAAGRLRPVAPRRQCGVCVLRDARYSRAAYVEFVCDLKVETLIGCHERAFGTGAVRRASCPTIR